MRDALPPSESMLNTTHAPHLTPLPSLLSAQIQDLVDEGRQVLLVSSGAVGLGRLRLGLSKEVVKNPANVMDRQACAAAGQEVRQCARAQRLLAPVHFPSAASVTVSDMLVCDDDMGRC